MPPRQALHIMVLDVKVAQLDAFADGVAERALFNQVWTIVVHYNWYYGLA
jgi:hypothetical protein